MKTKLIHLTLTLILLALLAGASLATAQGTALTYQGQLNDDAGPANGTYNFQFTVRDALTGGSAVGVNPLAATLVVSNGLFTATIDPGAGVFTGADRWLEIAVRTNGAAAFTNLSPRQKIVGAPYAIYAGGASAAGISGTLGAAQIPSLDASKITTGTLADARLSANVVFENGTNVFTGTNRFANVVLATNNNNLFTGDFAGDGAGLSNLPPTSISGALAATQIPNLDASKITTGTLADARLSANVALLNRTNVFTGTNRFTGVLLATNNNNLFTGDFAGDGAGLSNLPPTSVNGVLAPTQIPNLDASKITTGTLADARLSANVVFENGTNVFTGTNRFANVVLATNNNNLFTGDFAGDGAGLSNLPPTSISGALAATQIPNLDASKITTGTLADTRLSANVALLNRTNVFTGTNRFTGVVLATNNNNLFTGDLAGDGAGLSNLPPTSINGVLAPTQIPNLDASKITTGTLADARLSVNVVLENGTNVFTGTNRFASVVLATNNNNLFTGDFAGDGAGLSNLPPTSISGALAATQIPNLDASKITTGTLADARLSTNVARLDATQTFAGVNTFGQRVTVNGSIRARGGPPGVGVTNGYAFNGNGGDTDGGMFSSADGQLEFYVNATERMRLVGANLGLGTTNPTARLDVNGAIKVEGANILEFGAGVAGKEPSAGKLGYQVFTPGTLDIVGAGTNVASRKIKFFAEGGTTFNGEVIATVVSITGGSDLAEPYHVANAGEVKPLPGMVVTIDPGQIGRMRVAARAYDKTVAGILSGANGISPGIILRQAGSIADGALPVASIGRVWCWCDADASGPIEAGDMLTTSDTPGHAMRATDRERRDGAVIGKAMSSLPSGRGLVFVLVSLK